MPRTIGLILAAAALAGGCGKKAGAEPPVVVVAGDDQKMNAAIEKARKTVGTFITALNAPKAGQSGFSVKVAITDDGKTEHMWLTPVAFDGRTFRGTINNNPQAVKTVKIGDEQSVEPGKISDWMYIDKRRLVGGYTIRALRETMPPGERAEFEKGLPFVLD